MIKMIKGKKGWIARDYLVALLMFSAVILIFYVMIGYESVNYNAPEITNPQFQSHYDKIQNQTDSISKMFNATSSSGGFELLGSFGTIFKSMIAVIGLIFDSIGLFSEQVNFGMQDLGIPPVLTAILFPTLIAIVTVILILVIVNSAKFGKL